jgi:hypothetical protein
MLRGLGPFQRAIPNQRSTSMSIMPLDTSTLKSASHVYEAKF